jgi:hypothetical protein
MMSVKKVYLQLANYFRAQGDARDWLISFFIVAVVWLGGYFMGLYDMKFRIQRILDRGGYQYTEVLKDGVPVEGMVKCSCSLNSSIQKASTEFWYKQGRRDEVH